MSTPWPPADRPSRATVRGRQAVIEAAADGDLATVRRHLTDPDDRVRATAVLAAHRHGALTERDVSAAVADPSVRVRRAISRVAATLLSVDLAVLIGDDDSSVCETACWAAGERGDLARTLIDALTVVSNRHGEALCREAAVAALGAIGDDTGLPAILAAMDDRATVRRRAVLALAPFDSPAVTQALEGALADRDWQVRQAAEDLLGS